MYKTYVQQQQLDNGNIYVKKTDVTSVRDIDTADDANIDAETCSS
jgi:hypothetical protein